jgi:two-component sensor histidine kinase/putative methionine-R-sulfoxide reductase with GAF domain
MSRETPGDDRGTNAMTDLEEYRETLNQRNRELALLNRAGQALTSSLDLDQVLVTILEEVRRLLDVVVCSVWLIDRETGELVCRQATGTKSDIFHGWRLAVDRGLIGWVACSGQSSVVPNARIDERHFIEMDEHTGLEFRSVLTVPLRIKEEVTGVLQMVDTTVDRFGPADQMLAESLATSAAIAIENARLYEQAQQDAETRAALLREVNHRVKNNLALIVSLLHAEQEHAEMSGQAACQTRLEELISRVMGLSTAHNMLSASAWAPLSLSDLASQVIDSVLHALPLDKRISVRVSPSPVRVKPEIAQSLALVINELTTNSVKYALRNRDMAQISVRITLEDNHASKGNVLLEYRDDGPGYPEEVLRLERYNVGFDLIRTIVCDGMRGELTLRNDDGAVTSIRFKTRS